MKHHVYLRLICTVMGLRYFILYDFCFPQIVNYYSDNFIQLQVRKLRIECPNKLISLQSVHHSNLHCNDL